MFRNLYDRKRTARRWRWSAVVASLAAHAVLVGILVRGMEPALPAGSGLDTRDATFASAERGDTPVGGAAVAEARPGASEPGGWEVSGRAGRRPVALAGAGDENDRGEDGEGTLRVGAEDGRADRAEAEALRTARVAVPDTVLLGDTYSVRLQIDVPERDTAVRVWHASVAGSWFTLERQAPALQIPDSAATAVEWQWNLRAREPGAQRIGLLLEVVTGGEGTEPVRIAAVLQREVVVQARTVQRISRFVAGHWPWLGALALLPGVAWIAARIRSRRALERGGRAGPV